MENIKRGLLAYIELEGYTISSLAKKCSLDSALFKVMLKGESGLSESDEKEMIKKVMKVEDITLDDLNNSIYKQAQNKVSAKMEKMKEQKIFRERDKNRIKPFLEEFGELWSMYPDLRFGQLIESLSSKINMDSFYAEDDVWLEKIREMRDRK